MIAFKLAYRNLVGAGLRTWLNVLVLSISFVVIIWHKGFLDGWNLQARHDMINWEIGGGQYWHPEYDPYDPFTIIDSHGALPEKLQADVDSGLATPILISQATMYPDGRMISVLLKGIDPGQQVIKLPADQLAVAGDEIPVLIGTRLASNSKLKINDLVTVRWRDANGAFDATEVKIVGIFKTNVPTVDQGQLWLPLNRLQNMLRMPDEATIVIAQKDRHALADISGWHFQSLDFLLKDFNQMLKSKQVGGSILYIVLLALAMLAIFDTQVLSIFRRQKEIGTQIALGMTRWQVVRLFTLEGAMHGVLAAIAGAIYGIPLLSVQAIYGLAMPMATDDYGLTISERIFPVYSAGLVGATTLIVLITVTIVSFIPTRKITKMNPTDAIRGKIQ
ncbi:ABC transporter permease [candidate division KSB1 bacterium]|nr:ABC transporter permease [candidate division KSB1 bacterium]